MPESAQVAFTIPRSADQPCGAHANTPRRPAVAGCVRIFEPAIAERNLRVDYSFGMRSATSACGVRFRGQDWATGDKGIVESGNRVVG
jgi:hypothetical protein